VVKEGRGSEGLADGRQRLAARLGELLLFRLLWAKSF